MKKTFLMLALMAAGVAFVSPSISSVTAATVVVSQEEEKTQINPSDLPDPVKQAISADESLAGLQPSEAWQIKKADGSVQYEVSFDNGTEEKLTKTYDAEGNEIQG